MENMTRDRMFQLMGLRLSLEMTSIYVFLLRTRECSVLMIGVSLRRRRQDGTDHIMVEVIDRLRRVVRSLMPTRRSPEPECLFDITKIEQSLNGRKYGKQARVT